MANGFLMTDLLVCIYMTKINNRYRAMITPNLLVDARLLFTEDPAGSLDVLTPLLPIGVADYLLKTVFTREEIRGRAVNCTRLTDGNATPTWSLLGWLNRTPSYDALVSLKAGRIMKLLGQIEQCLKAGTFRPEGGRYPRRIWLKDLVGESAGRPDCPGYQRDRPKGGYARFEGEAVKKALRGRILFLEEVARVLSEKGLEIGSNLLDILQMLAFNDEIELLPALGFTAPGEITCFRCGGRIQLKSGFPPAELKHIFFHSPACPERMYQARCPICKLPSLYCEQCNTLGESRLCRGLFALGDQRTLNIPRTVQWPERTGVPALTPAQEQASRELVDFVRGSGPSDCLVWAVTGAGKTEVVLTAMAVVLGAGGRVLYAVPRRDVVKELAPRLQSSFEDIKVITNYGGSPEKFSSAPLVMATTHQVIRYYRQFDLVVLDEADAYPYRENKMLQMAVRRAAKPGGHTICLTATPDRQLMSGVNCGLTRLITIPVRYHGHPVPEPRCQKLVSFQKTADQRWTIAPYLLELLDKWLAEKDVQVFAFLPTVRMVETYGPVLAKALKGRNHPAGPALLAFSHAGDRDREQKRRDFKAGKFRLFLTTTIMERGITVKRAHVLVLEADFEPVFDEGTLIQMAGRAGRSAEFPDGEVVFVGGRINQAMRRARQKIRYLNTVARRAGYLKRGEQPRE